jgi:antitoxin (DNA-binding transcriptional repressor) of toxin-antitoxin stability system
LHTITAKQLHQETKSVLDQLERGDGVLITRNGRAIARLEPVEASAPPEWADVMDEVWKAHAQVRPGEVEKNPVLAERKQRRQ